MQGRRRAAPAGPSAETGRDGLTRTAVPGEDGSVLDVVIRRAEAEDLAPLRDVYRRSSLSNDGDRDVLLAHPEALELSGRPVGAGTGAGGGHGRTRSSGFATTSSDGSTLELESLFVDPDWMGRGIGTALVLDAAASARTAGLGSIEVTANEHALGFYGGAGFVAIGTAETLFGPAPRMELRLGPDGRPGQPRTRRIRPGRSPRARPGCRGGRAG